MGSNGRENAFMQQMQMQRASSFGNNKKRRFDSDLELQPPKQRQRMGLSQFSPMGASSTKMRSLLAQSWQQVLGRCLGFSQRRWNPPERVRRIICQLLLP